MTDSSCPQKPDSIAFVDLKAQQNFIRDRLNQSIMNVLDHGIYIMGPEVNQFESELSRFCNASYTLTCASGMDALMLALLAKQIQPGDVVFVPAFTFVATAEAVALLGGIPFFVDVDAQTFNICPQSLEEAIIEAHKKNLRTVGIIPVDLFGLPADYDALHTIAQKHNLWIIADAAQSFGASYKERPVGTLAELTCTSFFPAKPLGGYGDGGAIFTEHSHHVEVISSCRVHGQGSHKYENVRLGLTGRLDTLQAAILLEKLGIFRDEIDQRNRIATSYQSLLSDDIITPRIPEGYSSVWAQYTLRVQNREELQTYLHAQGIPTMVYYPIPLSQQVAYQDYPKTNLPVTEQLCQEVLSLPMHPYLDPETQAYICYHVNERAV